MRLRIASSIQGSTQSLVFPRRVSRGASVWLGCALLAVSAGTAAAAEEASAAGAKFGVALGAEFEFGGDEVATVTFDDESTQDLKAGQGVTLEAGGYFKPNAASPVSVRATVGYKFVTTAASNADIGIDRLVFKLASQYEWTSGFWVGGGLVRHTGIKFDADGLGEDVEFEDASGFTAEVGYKWFSLSYTGMDYEDEFGNKIDASNIGIGASLKF